MDDHPQYVKGIAAIAIYSCYSCNPCNPQITTARRLRSSSASARVPGHAERGANDFGMFEALEKNYVKAKVEKLETRKYEVNIIYTILEPLFDAILVVN
jgi:hypothetical protein